MVSPYKHRGGGARRNWTRAAIIAVAFVVLIATFYVAYSTFFAKGPQVAAATDYVFGDPYNITVVISRDYGETTLKTAVVNYTSGMTVLTALTSVAEVDETGGFVKAIDGLRSQSSLGKPVDWIYYVNGIYAIVYAPLYDVHPGDVIRWDYHRWVGDSSAGAHTSGAIVSDLFAGFAYGYRGVDQGGIWPTYIVDCGGFAKEAERLNSAFAGWGIKTTVKLWSDLTKTEKEKGNLFLVGTFDSDPIKFTNNNYNSNNGMGLYYHYDGTGVRLLDWDGDVLRTLAHCGVIAASKNPWNPGGLDYGTNLCWIATGVTKADVKAALDTLIEDPHVLSDKYGGFAVLDGDVYEIYG